MSDTLERNSVPNGLSAPRIIGLFNHRGVGTLIGREVGRLWKMPMQTLIGPVVILLIFYIIFSGLSGKGSLSIGGLSFAAFLVPGLVMMLMAQNAFAQSTVSLHLSKIQNHLVDLLMAPFTPFELVLGYTISGVARGLVVGAACAVVFLPIEPMGMTDLGYLLFHAVMGSAMLALLGLVVGIWADTFDHTAMIQGLIITPATFLSGSFFSIEQLPEAWRLASLFNPFFYIIDGFRYGITGYAESSLPLGLAVVLTGNILLFYAAYALLKRGYKIKR